MCCWLASFIRSPSAPPIATQIPRLGPAQIESKGWPNRRAFHRTSRVMAAPTLASVLFAFSISSFPIVLSIRRSSSNRLLRGQRLCRYRRFRTAQVSSPQLRPPALPDARLPFTEAATSLGSSNRQRFLQDTEAMLLLCARRLLAVAWLFAGAAADRKHRITSINSIIP